MATTTGACVPAACDKATALEQTLYEQVRQQLLPHVAAFQELAYGIARVDVSIDAGATWRPATLGKDLGRYSFQEFELRVTSVATGEHVVMARATSRAGETQVERLIHNPAGYHHNVMQQVRVEVV